MSRSEEFHNGRLGPLRTYREPAPDVGHQRIGAYFEHDDEDHAVAGYIDHKPSEEGTHVRIVHVEEDRRRMGVASHLMGELEKEYPKWTTDHFTEEGKKFFGSRPHGGEPLG